MTRDDLWTLIKARARYGHLMTSAPPPEILPWRRRLQEHKFRAVSWIEDRGHALGWGGIVAGGLCATVAVWPLAVTAWDFLGLTGWQTWRIALFGTGSLVLAVGVAGANWKRTSPVRLIWLILVAWLMAAVAVVVLTSLAWLLLDTPGWKPPADLTPRHLEAITTRAFAIVAGLSGVALLVIAYRRQRTTETSEQREVIKLFNERFTAAYTELGSEHAAVRLGAVHALAHLADDAPSEEEVQMVIDVLCAYLRMPYPPEPGALPENADKAQREEHHASKLEFTSSREVRHTIIRIIGNHLREPTRWRGKNFDFTGVAFDGGNLSLAHFTGGEVSFNGAEFNGGKVSFNGAEFSGGEVSFNGAEFNGGKVSFDGAEFNGGTVSFNSTNFINGVVTFEYAQFASSAVAFDMAQFNGGTVFFALADFIGGTVSFNGAYFADGKVFFSGSEFTGGGVYFMNTKFASRKVYFEGAHFISGTVYFGAASGICPSGLKSAIDNGESGVAMLPVQWRLPPE